MICSYFETESNRVAVRFLSVKQCSGPTLRLDSVFGILIGRIKRNRQIIREEEKETEEYYTKG